MRSLIIGVLLIVQPAAAAGRAGLVGEVRDPQGGVVPGATVTVTSVTTGAMSRAVADASGRFQFTDLSAGPYDLAATISGFKTARGRVQVVADDTLALRVNLQMGALTEAITVRAVPPSVPAALVVDPATARAAATLAETTRPAPSLAAESVIVRANVAPAGGAVRVGGSITEPRKLRDVRPIYPADALGAGIRGVVILEATIDDRGVVQSLRVLRGVPQAPSLDLAAADAVKGWVYSPARLNGVPIEVVMTATVTFDLR